ncbi:Neurofilament medium polypeptide [Paramuricea clavata]|uniref:Neurofilament medium polypeptide n=1 Tax=Paramuricea clavata TaxID=317549 RepID=A0A7D9I1N2_PARCT|nr:Neurofilament medium polypeptide [Paramuricea clavata]
MNEVIDLKKKVDNLEGAKGDKVRKPPAEHEVSTSQRRKISCPLVACKAKEQHEEEHSEEEVVDDSGKDVDDNFEFVCENESDDDDDILDDIDDLKLQTRSTLPPLIAEFQEWLASPDGSKKDEKQDFLFTQIFIDNANRPDVLAHLTMKEHTNIHKQDEHYVITVKNTTAHVHGPARIVLSDILYSIGVMQAHVRTRINGPVFLSWNRNAMKSGHITKAVQSVFTKAGLDVKITSTSFRKAAVTKVHIDNPDMSRKLADLMAHNEATAKRYYLLSEKTSVEVSKNLGRLM